MSSLNPQRPSVAVGAIVVEAGRVLLIERGHPPNQGQWSVPGGRIEWGESMVEAVIREVREETGLDIEVGPLVELVERMDDADPPTYHFIIVDFLARSRGGTLVAGDDASAVRWVAPNEWDALPLTRHLAVVLQKALRMAGTPGVWDTHPG